MTADSLLARAGSLRPQLAATTTPRDLAPEQLGARLGRSVATGTDVWRSIETSSIVTGLSESGKTTSVVIPAVLDWNGRQVVSTTKTDILRCTWQAAADRGGLAVFDPLRLSGGVFPRAVLDPDPGLRRPEHRRGPHQGPHRTGRRAGPARRLRRRRPPRRAGAAARRRPGRRHRHRTARLGLQPPGSAAGADHPRLHPRLPALRRGTGLGAENTGPATGRVLPVGPLGVRRHVHPAGAGHHRHPPVPGVRRRPVAHRRHAKACTC